MNTTCPICDADINFQPGTVEGEILLCPDCGSELEVISLDPPQVEEAPMEEEDWGE